MLVAATAFQGMRRSGWSEIRVSDFAHPGRISIPAPADAPAGGVC